VFMVQAKIAALVWTPCECRRAMLSLMDQPDGKDPEQADAKVSDQREGNVEGFRKPGKKGQPEAKFSAEKISLEEISTALKRSGYLLEARVAQYFKGKGWAVQPNARYPDPIMGKARELDMQADLMLEISSTPPFTDSVTLTVACECKNNLQPMVFFTSSGVVPQLWHSEGEHELLWGMPPRIRGSIIDVPDAVELPSWHPHFRASKIATQFCSFSRKKERNAEWMASHGEDDYGMFTKLGDFARFQKSTFNSRWQIGTIDPEKESVVLELAWLVLVLQGEIFEATVVGEEVELKPCDRILYRQPVIVEGGERVFFIDVMTEAAIPDLVDEMNLAAQKVKEAVLSRLELFRHSVLKEAEDLRERELEEAFKEIERGRNGRRVVRTTRFGSLGAGTILEHERRQQGSTASRLRNPAVQEPHR
jgi:hypothetical protein